VEIDRRRAPRTDFLRAAFGDMMDYMLQIPAISTIAQTIQLSLAPVFMLAGIGQLLNVLAGRLSRVIDRARKLEHLHPSSSGPEHDRHVTELRLLDRRMTIINAALFLSVTSAIMTCLLIALLFVGSLAKLHLGRHVAIAFILAMLLLIAGLIAFMVEVRISLRAFRIRPELLEKMK
jgi:MFS family permease